MSGMSQEELSLRAGLSHHTVFKVENGLSTPQAATLHKLATALNTDPIKLWELVS
jgi:transcriptional regulator with XRE-family HTH domain